MNDPFLEGKEAGFKEGIELIIKMINEIEDNKNRVKYTIKDCNYETMAIKLKKEQFFVVGGIVIDMEE